MSGLISSIASVLFSPSRYMSATTAQTFTGLGQNGDQSETVLQQTILLPDCAIEEQHEDRLTITRHPVQRGAKITDHIFKEPPILRLRWAWSNSALVNFLGGEAYAKQAYQSVLALQVSGIPLTISTGKRLYYNMLLEEIGTMTDASTEYSAPLEITATGIILVQTQAASLPAIDAAASPQQTSPTVQQGTVQADPTATPGNSLLNQAKEALTGVVNV